ncbi:MAG: helix-turn-helix transcriptional regulator [Agathobacter sp.]|nr:helix-turn-helix transcriptional regulator [Agathobacter sp.]
MFQDNLKILRKNKGYTQEELASRLKVVRQTVSKWEKGLSVPDAEMLLKIAEEFEVSVSELLGSKIEDEQSKSDVAQQLARINEQLAIKNRRAKRVWKVVGIIVGVCILLNILAIFAFSLLKVDTSNGPLKDDTIEYNTEIVEE